MREFEHLCFINEFIGVFSFTKGLLLVFIYDCSYACLTSVSQTDRFTFRYYFYIMTTSFNSFIMMV